MIVKIGFVAAGIVCGALYFALLRWNAYLYTRPKRIWKAAVVQVLRFGTLACLLVVMALHGAWPLLLTALGVLTARHVVVRWWEL